MKKTNSQAETINQRKIINGEDDGLMRLSPIKHDFADRIYRIMLKNTWMPQEVEMSKDIEMWNKAGALTEQEKRVYCRSLAFVSNLDGLQTHNLSSNIVRHLTSPEVVLAVVRQASEEGLHVHGYATMIDALGLNVDEIYGLYRTDRELFNKNEQVLEAVNRISDPAFKTGTFPSDQMFLEACIGNVILEGIYFYSAFLVFYVLKRNNKMPGSAEMIQWINRDENVHLELFVEIVKAIKAEQPELWTESFQERITENVRKAVAMELSWGLSCIGKGIFGLNREELKGYLEFVGDQRLKQLGLSAVWESENPCPWIDDFTQGNMIEVNFFEGRVKDYKVGSLEW